MVCGAAPGRSPAPAERSRHCGKERPSQPAHPVCAGGGGGGCAAAPFSASSNLKKRRLLQTAGERPAASPPDRHGRQTARRGAAVSCGDGGGGLGETGESECLSPDYDDDRPARAKTRPRPRPQRGRMCCSPSRQSDPPFPVRSYDDDQNGLSHRPSSRVCADHLLTGSPHRSPVASRRHTHSRQLKRRRLLWVVTCLLGLLLCWWPPFLAAVGGQHNPGPPDDGSEWWEGEDGGEGEGEVTTPPPIDSQMCVSPPATNCNALDGIDKSRNPSYDLTCPGRDCFKSFCCRYEIDKDILTLLEDDSGEQHDDEHEHQRQFQHHQRRCQEVEDCFAVEGVAVERNPRRDVECREGSDGCVGSFCCRYELLGSNGAATEAATPKTIDEGLHLDGSLGCDAKADTDQDGTPDCQDGCPLDPVKVEGGRCGCGHDDFDPKCGWQPALGACFDGGRDYGGDYVPQYHPVGAWSPPLSGRVPSSPEECQEECRQHPSCLSFSFSFTTTHGCFLKADPASNATENAAVVSGPKKCTGAGHAFQCPSSIPNGWCQQLCEKTPGGVRCKCVCICEKGYQLSLSSVSSVEGGDTQDPDHDSSSTVSALGRLDGLEWPSYRRRGLGEAAGGGGGVAVSRACVDVDECALGSSWCSGGCNNTKGGYDCYCDPPLLLDSDGKTCKDPEGSQERDPPTTHQDSNDTGRSGAAELESEDPPPQLSSPDPPSPPAPASPHVSSVHTSTCIACCCQWMQADVHWGSQLPPKPSPEIRFFRLVPEFYPSIAHLSYFGFPEVYDVSASASSGHMEVCELQLLAAQSAPNSTATADLCSLTTHLPPNTTTRFSISAYSEGGPGPPAYTEWIFTQALRKPAVNVTVAAQPGRIETGQTVSVTVSFAKLGSEQLYVSELAAMGLTSLHLVALAEPESGWYLARHHDLIAHWWGGASSWHQLPQSAIRHLIDQNPHTVWKAHDPCDPSLPPSSSLRPVPPLPAKAKEVSANRQAPAGLRLVFGRPLCLRGVVLEWYAHAQPQLVRLEVKAAISPSWFPVSAQSGARRCDGDRKDELLLPEYLMGRVEAIQLYFAHTCASSHSSTTGGGHSRCADDSSSSHQPFSFALRNIKLEECAAELGSWSLPLPTTYAAASSNGNGSSANATDEEALVPIERLQENPVTVNVTVGTIDTWRVLFRIRQPPAHLLLANMGAGEGNVVTVKPTEGRVIPTYPPVDDLPMEDELEITEGYESVEHPRLEVSRDSQPLKGSLVTKERDSSALDASSQHIGVVLGILIPVTLVTIAFILLSAYRHHPCVTKTRSSITSLLRERGLLPATMADSPVPSSLPSTCQTTIVDTHGGMTHHHMPPPAIVALPEASSDSGGGKSSRGFQRLGLGRGRVSIVEIPSSRGGVDHPANTQQPVTAVRLPPVRHFTLSHGWFPQVGGPIGGYGFIGTQLTPIAEEEIGEGGQGCCGKKDGSHMDLRQPDGDRASEETGEGDGDCDEGEKSPLTI